MDDALDQAITELAETHGLDPALIREALLGQPLPEAQEHAIAAVLADLGRFAEAAANVTK